MQSYKKRLKIIVQKQFGLGKIKIVKKLMVLCAVVSQTRFSTLGGSSVADFLGLRVAAEDPPIYVCVI